MATRSGPADGPSSADRIEAARSRLADGAGAGWPSWPQPLAARADELASEAAAMLDAAVACAAVGTCFSSLRFRPAGPAPDSGLSLLGIEVNSLTPDPSADYLSAAETIADVLCGDLDPLIDRMMYRSSVTVNASRWTGGVHSQPDPASTHTVKVDLRGWGPGPSGMTNAEAALAFGTWAKEHRPGLDQAVIRSDGFHVTIAVSGRRAGLAAKDAVEAWKRHTVRTHILDSLAGSSTQQA
jgi:hypothetical protein